MIAQIEYDEQDCRGIPSKVFDLQKITHVESQDFAECVNGVQWNYLSYYPAFNEVGAGYGATYTLDETCDPQVRNYYGYDFRRADFCARVVRQNNVWVQSNVQGCESTGTFSYRSLLTKHQ